MRVIVRLGEPYWRQVDLREVELELPAGATVGLLLDELARAYPALRAVLEESDLPATVFLGDKMAGTETPLSEGARPTLLWALAGG